MLEEMTKDVQVCRSAFTFSRDRGGVAQGWTKETKITLSFFTHVTAIQNNQPFCFSLFILTLVTLVAP